MKGLLVTLEGIDGSGKSTAARRIAARLQEMMPERELVLTAEPTSGDAGRILRKLLSRPADHEPSPEECMEELFLFMADHARHLAEIIHPSLDEGAIIISDRYADSTAAYQGVTLQGIVADPLQWIRDIYAPWNVLPNRTLLFSIEPSFALQRIRSRIEREKFEQARFLRAVDANFRRLAAMEPQRFRSIDASQDAQCVAEEALRAILEIMP